MCKNRQIRPGVCFVVSNPTNTNRGFFNAETTPTAILSQKVNHKKGIMPGKCLLVFPTFCYSPTTTILHKLRTVIVHKLADKTLIAHYNSMLVCCIGPLKLTVLFPLGFSTQQNPWSKSSQSAIENSPAFPAENGALDATSTRNQPGRISNTILVWVLPSCIAISAATPSYQVPGTLP